jgi:hypothetical protein
VGYLISRKLRSLEQVLSARLHLAREEVSRGLPGLPVSFLAARMMILLPFEKIGTFYQRAEKNIPGSQSDAESSSEVGKCYKL